GWGNYVRNSVKAVVDAYHGTVDFYIAEDEPVIRALARVFPGTFKPLSEMPRALRDHVRYPEDLFRLQASILTRYHMTNPQVFYNQEDVWELPREFYESAEVDMEPYYVITRFGLIRRAAAIFEEARRLAGSGDWPGYGQALEQLGAVLEQLSDAARTP